MSEAPLHGPSARGERTREAILGAAGELFAARGFAESRLEDVAAAVGIRRASIVYHFRDKQALYDAVLGELIDVLRARIEAAFATPGSTAERIEAAVRVWVDFHFERPTFGRLLLRELANAEPGGLVPPLSGQIRSFVELVQRFDRERVARGEAFRDSVDPLHFAGAIAGATVLYSVALPALAPGAAAPSALPEHRAAVLAVARRLLAVEPASSRPGDASAPLAQEER